MLFTDLVIAAGAFGTASTAADKGNRDAIASLPAYHLASHRGDSAGKLVTRHMRQHDIGIMSHPAMPVAAAQAGRLDLDDHAFKLGGGIGDFGQDGRLPEGFVEDGFHDKLSLRLVAHRFDIIAVGIEDEGAVIIGMIVRPEPRFAIVAPAGGECHAMEFIDRLT